VERLFSPWRSQYIASFFDESGSGKSCVLCSAHQTNSDDDNFIVIRGKRCYVVMNLFPYNSGHVMVVPYRHTPAFADLDEEECSEVMSLLKKLMVALQKTSHPDGFNIGSNIGRSAGAGIDKHVHFHLVPRWNGDTNFMPTLADTKLISEDMRETLLRLRQALQ
jgi:ATP adenylyltransferase